MVQVVLCFMDCMGICPEIKRLIGMLLRLNRIKGRIARKFAQLSTSACNVIQRGEALDKEGQSSRSPQKLFAKSQPYDWTQFVG